MAIDRTVVDRGEGTAVVLTHGSFMDHTMFAPRIEALEDRYRIIAYNHRARADRSVSRRVERSGRGRLRRAGASGRRSQTEGLRVQNRNGSLRSEFVLVQQTAESVAP